MKKWGKRRRQNVIKTSNETLIQERSLSKKFKNKKLIDYHYLTWKI